MVKLVTSLNLTPFVIKINNTLKRNLFISGQYLDECTIKMKNYIKEEGYCWMKKYDKSICICFETKCNTRGVL